MSVRTTRSRSRSLDSYDPLIPILIGSIVIGLGAVLSVILNSVIPVILSGIGMAVGLIVNTIITVQRHNAPVEGSSWRRAHGSKDKPMQLVHPSNTNDYKLCQKRANTDKKNKILRLPGFSR